MNRSLRFGQKNTAGITPAVGCYCFGQFDGTAVWGCSYLTPAGGAYKMGWVEMLNKCEKMIKVSLEPVRELALGGTAVGVRLFFDFFNRIIQK